MKLGMNRVTAQDDIVKKLPRKFVKNFIINIKYSLFLLKA